MRTFAALAISLAMAATAAGQEFRGAVTGRVNDKSGGVLPGVTVTATNVATNVSSTTVTTGEGLFTIPYLIPGTYTVAAELTGFKKAVREGLDVRIGDRLVVDLSLEVGQLEETVLVTASSPLLEMGSASAGQVIDEKRISMMPLSDGNPFVLSRLVPGVAFTGDLKFSRPFDNAGTSGINADGASGGNEFTLDGSPNMTSGRRVAFVPPAGAVQQFKVGTATFDAGDGHTAGAVVNVTLKSGTNSLKGEGYYYLRRDALSATDFFVNKTGGTKPELKYNRPGGYLGGPVRSNRTFFFGAVEWLYDTFPEPLPQTVPTQAMRNGDFSALLAQGTIIYDPATAHPGRLARSPAAVSGQHHPGQPHQSDRGRRPQFFPLPNQTADNQGRNNFFYVNPRNDTFYSVSTRVDHRLTDKQQLFVRYAQRSARVAQRHLRRSERHRPDRQLPVPDERRRHVRPRVHDDVEHAARRARRVAALQGAERPAARRPVRPVDARVLLGGGRPVRRREVFSALRLRPVLGRRRESLDGHQPQHLLVPADVHAHLRQSFAAGRLRLAPVPGVRVEPAAQAGEYVFRNANAFTRQQDNSTGVFGQDLATFMLGFPTAGTIDINAAR